MLLAVGRKRIVFIDNNFYGNDREPGFILAGPVVLPFYAATVAFTIG